MKQYKKYRTVLSIAGSDSGGCAGIQADIKTLSACGCFATTAITALTAQNTEGVIAVHVTPVDIVKAQIVAVLEDIGADAIKIGMLPTVEIVECVADVLTHYSVSNIVLDPVMVATSGDELIGSDAANAIIKYLLPIATLVTPNIPEAKSITGIEISSEGDFERVANHFTTLAVRNLLLKSGHLDNAVLTDYLFSDMQHRTVVDKFAYERISSPNTHGTGCTLSSSIAAYLALGYELKDAVTLAEEYIHKAILAGAEYAVGHGHGPLHHFFKYWE